MVALTDAMAIFRTYPHLDMAATGARAYALLESMLQSGEKPHKTWRQIPFLMPLSSQHTGSEPCRTFYESLPGLTLEGVTTIDFACGFPPADIWHCGPAIVAYGASAEAVEHAADDLYEMIVASEIGMKDPLLSAGDAVERAMAAGRPGAPAVIADVQDNPGAGGSSDTTSLLRSLVAKGAQGAAMSSFWDPDAAAAAHAAGEGRTISLGLGGKFGPEGEEPFQADFVVERLSDGKAVCEGDMMQGFEIDIGPTALLRVADTGCDVRIVVSTERIQCLDQAFYRVAGVEPVEQTILAIKSTVHYRADFDAIASAVIMAACPGFHPCRLENLSYENLRPGVRLGPNGPVYGGAAGRSLESD
jgi:microcystin degradation protein MlrC